MSIVCVEELLLICSKEIAEVQQKRYRFTHCEQTNKQSNNGGGLSLFRGSSNANEIFWLDSKHAKLKQRQKEKGPKLKIFFLP